MGISLLLRSLSFPTSHGLGQQFTCSTLESPSLPLHTLLYLIGVGQDF